LRGGAPGEVEPVPEPHTRCDLGGSRLTDARRNRPEPRAGRQSSRPVRPVRQPISLL